MKTLAIGDIHGCHETLIKFMNMVLTNEQVERIVFLGDYVDRGPASAQVVQMIYEFVTSAMDIEVIALKGNHEDMFLDMLNDPSVLNNVLNCLNNGGDRTVQSYVDMEQQFRDAGMEMKKFTIQTIDGLKSFFVPKHHIEFMSKLPVRFEDETYHYVHAGMRPCVHVQDQDPDDMLWIRYEFLYSKELFGGKKVIHGHTPTRVPEQHENRIAIDLGLGKDGDLCGYFHDIKGGERRFYKVDHEPKDVFDIVKEWGGPVRTGGW